VPGSLEHAAEGWVVATRPYLHKAIGGRGGIGHGVVHLYEGPEGAREYAEELNNSMRGACAVSAGSRPFRVYKVFVSFIEEDP
jgi:hypothetical protein